MGLRLVNVAAVPGHPRFYVFLASQAREFLQTFPSFSFCVVVARLCVVFRNSAFMRALRKHATPSNPGDSTGATSEARRVAC